MIKVRYEPKVLQTDHIAHKLMFSATLELHTYKLKENKGITFFFFEVPDVWN